MGKWVNPEAQTKPEERISGSPALNSTLKGSTLTPLFFIIRAGLMCEGTSGRNTALIAALVSELVCTVVCECECVCVGVWVFSELRNRQRSGA